MTTQDTTEVVLEGRTFQVRGSTIKRKTGEPTTATVYAEAAEGGSHIYFDPSNGTTVTIGSLGALNESLVGKPDGLLSMRTGLKVPFDPRALEKFFASRKSFRKIWGIRDYNGEVFIEYSE